MTDCADYKSVNPSSEKLFVSKETTAEADYENPDVVLWVLYTSPIVFQFQFINDCREKNDKKECCANDYEIPVSITDTKTQSEDQDTAV